MSYLFLITQLLFENISLDVFVMTSSTFINEASTWFLIPQRDELTALLIEFAAFERETSL